MIRDLDATLERMLLDNAPPGSLLTGADVSFEVPDGDWRGRLNKLTVSCYLYDIRQNRQLRSQEPVVQRDPDGQWARRREAPVRIDCGYCISAWSPAESESTLEEHRLLSDVLLVLLRHPTIPGSLLQGRLVDQIPPYPTVIAAPDGIKNQPEFWTALNQQLKPSLYYVVTLAWLVDEEPSAERVVDVAVVPVNDETVIVRA